MVNLCIIIATTTQSDCDSTSCHRTKQVKEKHDYCFLFSYGMIKPAVIATKKCKRQQYLILQNSLE